MAAAVLADRKKKMGYLRTAQIYNVSRTTLFQLAKEVNVPLKDILPTKVYRKAVFNKIFEHMLENYALTIEQRLCGCIS